MRILFCVEFYFPSRGGAQEVVRQVAERLAKRGHAVTVVTSRIDSRDFENHKGVRIVEFAVSGNLVRGLQGEVDRYQRFLAGSDFDVVLFYAAQQWTFDAAWSVMTAIRARKVLVPCGYSGLYESSYGQYFADLPGILRTMDAVVYHAKSYRDTDFGRSIGLKSEVLIPNGADRAEFSVARDAAFRRSIAVDEDAFLILTVGTMTGLKGHIELVQAFAKTEFNGRKAALILNGNAPEDAGQPMAPLKRIFNLLRLYGPVYALSHTLKVFLGRCGLHVGRSASIQSWATKINREQGVIKKVVLTDLPRERLVQAYLSADLFVFASNIEYSPLVLFEACAAGLPFLTVPVGNAVEIADWTGGGELCEAPIDSRGYTRVDPAILARRIEELVGNAKKLNMLGQSGLSACMRSYNWDNIAMEYEFLFARLVDPSYEPNMAAIAATPRGS